MKFELTVKVVLQTFAVFVGFTLNEAIRDALDATKGVLPKPATTTGGATFVDSVLRAIAAFQDWVLGVAVAVVDWRWGALVALIALLLRFIIGSTIHLNRTYVPPPAANPLPKGQGTSKSVFMLCKDVAFLVFFGFAALLMAQGMKDANLREFLFGGIAYLFLAALWCGVDYVVRDILNVGGAKETTAYVASLSSKWWLWLCLLQLAATVVLFLLCPSIDLSVTAWILAALYVLCLYLDLRIVLRS